MILKPEEKEPFRKWLEVQYYRKFVRNTLDENAKSLFGSVDNAIVRFRTGLDLD